MVTNEIDWMPTEPSHEESLTGKGFRFGDKGTHTSRTIMLSELSELLDGCGPTVSRKSYADAIIEDNLLNKKTTATRRLTNQRLGELYALDATSLLFRIMRQFWQTDVAGRPLLAMLMALCRDPLLRATATEILRLPIDEELRRSALTEAVRSAVGPRLNDNILDKVVRNAGSSWTQSGHLSGRVRKIRKRVKATPLSTAYALCIGHIAGERGSALLSTFWAKVLDSTPDELLFLAMDARRLGVLDLREAGSVVDITFPNLLKA